MATKLARLAHHIGYLTQTAGTVIAALIPPRGENYKSRIGRLIYTAAATVHDLVIMKALGKTTVSEDAADGATTLVINEEDFAGQTVAANDYIVVKHTDGTYGYYLVSANSSGSLTINALSQAVAAGQPVWIMGAPADSGHLTYKSVANSRVELADEVNGIAESGFEAVVSDVVQSRSGFGDPMLFYSANGTNAGFLQLISVGYVRYPQN